MFKFFSAPLCVVVQLFALNCTLNHDPVSAAPADTALPAIRNAPGTINDGQAVQIKGFYFGNKNPVKPFLWADFSTNMNPSSLGIRTSWDQDTSTTNCVRTNNLPSGSGNQYGVVVSWYAVNWPNYTGTGDRIGGSLMTRNGTTWTKIYAYGKRYRDFDGSHLNYKHFRIWNLNTTGPNDWMSVYLNGEGISTNECYATPGRYQGSVYTLNQWDTEEFIWTYNGGTGLNPDGTPGPGHGIYDYTRDGINQVHMESIDNCNNTLRELRVFDNFTANVYPPNGSKCYMTDFYIDTTYSRIIIGNDSTLATSTHREIQIPTVWSSGSITFIANQGSFALDSAAYIFVVNEKNVASSGKKIIWGTQGIAKQKQQ